MIRRLLAWVLAVAATAGAGVSAQPLAQLLAQPLLDWTEEEVTLIARHGPWPPPPVRDPSNRVSASPAAVRLGEHLFYDTRLSDTGQTSCATCHRPDRDWSDGLARAQGTVELDRRTPSLWNVGYGPWFGWDGAGDSLWAQSIRPTGEVDSGRLAGLARLASSPFNLLGSHSDDTTGEAARRTRHVQRLHSNFGEFRVPGLRQTARGGPYMHNGSLASLDDVVRHYSEVSPDRLHSDGVPLVRPLGLSAEEQGDLVAFLRSLDAEVPPRPPVPPLCP